MIITLYENGLISTEKSGIMDDTPPQAAGYRLLSWPSFRAWHGIQSGFLDTGFRRYD